MIGDCDSCGHSVAYHVPLVGCIKCDCDEFVVRVVGWMRRRLRRSQK